MHICVSVPFITKRESRRWSVEDDLPPVVQPSNNQSCLGNILTDLCCLGSKEHNHVDCHRRQVACLCVLNVDVSLDLAMFGELLRLSGLQSTLRECQLYRANIRFQA